MCGFGGAMHLTWALIYLVSALALIDFPSILVRGSLISSDNWQVLSRRPTQCCCYGYQYYRTEYQAVQYYCNPDCRSGSDQKVPISATVILFCDRVISPLWHFSSFSPLDKRLIINEHKRRFADPHLFDWRVRIRISLFTLIRIRIRLTLTIVIRIRSQIP